MIRKMLGEVAMMPVNGLEPEPALGSVLFAEGAETASGAGTGARGAGDAGRRGGFHLRRWQDRKSVV